MRPQLPALGGLNGLLARRSRRSRWAGLLFVLAAALAAPSASAETPAVPGAGEPIKVVVAVLPFRVHSAVPLDYLERSLPDLLASRLEASGRVRVLEALSVRETLIAHGEERTEDALRRLARELGADYVVAGSLTELAGRYSLDVRVIPLESGWSARSFAFQAAGDEELLDRVEELSDRVLELVGSASPSTRVAQLRLEGLPEELARALFPQLRVQQGEPFESSAAEQDLAFLRGLPDVATATLATERGVEGVVVTYRVVAAGRIFPEPEFQGGAERVAELRVRGNRRIEANAILARVSTRVGDPFLPARVASDVREIHALGFFRDVRVLSEPGSDGRVLIFEVEENPVVRRVSISGNDSVDGDRIRDALTLTTGATLDYPLLFENRMRIEQLYRAEGFYLATVGYEIEALSGDAVSVDFQVDEGKKLRLKRIAFEGNQHFDDDELRKGLGTKPWRWYSLATHYLDRSGTYSEPVFLQDIQAVNEKYLNAGFLQVEVGEPDVQAGEDGLDVRVEIREGDQFRIGKVEVTGDESLDLEALQETLVLEHGEVFDRSALTADVERLERYYTNRGFYFARVNPLTRPNQAERSVDVSFEVEKGPLHFVRRIDVAGNATTVDPVIRREMQLVEGELYSQRAIELSQLRLRSLGFFEEVEFEPTRTDEADQLDLGVKVVERPTGSLSFGAGVSSQDGFVVSGSLSQSNLFGRGYAVSGSADLGGSTSRFFFSFSDPYLLDTDFSLSSQLFRTDVEYEDFEQQQNGIEFALGHSLSEDARSRGFLRYNFANREIQEDSGVNAAAVIFRELLQGEESTSLLGLALRSDTRDDRIAPTRGYLLASALEFAGLGGFSTFLRAEGRGSVFLSPPGWFPGWFPFKEKSALMLGARTGYALPFNSISDWDSGLFEVSPLGSNDEVRALGAIDDDLELPLSERYFLGGLGTFQLRGFKARSIGPRRAILRQAFLGSNADLFTPVGRLPDGTCFDNGLTQGDGDGQCNSLDDQVDDDFDDLDETDVIGGNSFLSLTTEYRFPISEALGLVGVLFLDAGNAFDENHSLLDVDLWRTGTGFGVQWFSPFGPLQAFLGFPLDKLETEDSPVFEFSVGGASF